MGSAIGAAAKRVKRGGFKDKANESREATEWRRLRALLARHADVRVCRFLGDFYFLVDLRYLCLLDLV